MMEKSLFARQLAFNVIIKQLASNRERREGVEPMTSERWPTELRLAKDKRSLQVAFDDGTAFDLPAEYLRVTSPRPRFRGTAPPSARPCRASAMWRSSACEPVGNYAVKLVFDDMHDTGIYGWDYLYRLGAEQAERWQAYLDELAAKGLSRDRVR